jgi:phosphate transport system permease protein
MTPKSRDRRRWANRTVIGLSGVSAVLGLFFLGWILMVILKRGMGAMTPAFFVELPTPPGIEGGGVGNAIVGTLLMTGLATLAGVPIGALGGIFLAEFGKRSRLADAVRFMANVLMGTPSIIVGIFVYAVVVIHTGHFSGYAGAISLAIIMLPIVARTTEDMLELVDNTLRESALALGATYWKTIFQVVFRAAKAGLLTGVLLAIARVSGETAPLLFTALNSPNWNDSLNEPTANLTVTIFNFAMSPYDDWQQMAWGASLLITVGVLVLTVASRAALFRKGGAQK